MFVCSFVCVIEFALIVFINFFLLILNEGADRHREGGREGEREREREEGRMRLRERDDNLTMF